MSLVLPEVYLARHGETAWTISHRHTGRTEVPLTERGERNARALGARLAGVAFDRVWTSPLGRARRTCELAGLGPGPGAANHKVEIVDDLMEWDYGRYDGKTTAEIRAERPDWSLFRDGCPDGESIDQVKARADRVIDRVRALEGRTVLFGHSHFFRALAARWLGLPPSDGRLLLLSTASLSVLGYEHGLDEPVVRLWNDDRHVGD